MAGRVQCVATRFHSVQWELAFGKLSGIIATNLGKSATIVEVAGRKRRIHHSKSLPLPDSGRGFFLCALRHRSIFKKININNTLLNIPGTNLP